MPSAARIAAFRILIRVEQQHAYAAELLHSERLRELSPVDRALCTALVMGVLRWRSRLDLGIAAVSSQPLSKLDSEVLTALRLGAYQVGFLRVPARAAVHESVELVKSSSKRSAVPFANAILRKLATKTELLRQPSRPATTAIELAENFAHPAWLVERWAARLGFDQAAQICAYGQQEPPAALRLMDAKAETTLGQEAVITAPGALLRDARRVVSGDVTRTRAFREGQVLIQDEASQLVALLVGHGWRILDCCAAPGGKTAVMAKQNPQASIVATELHPHRARLLRRRVQANNVSVVAGDASALPLRGDFDRVLADVPCSGTGTLARNPEIKWRLGPADLANLHQRQVAILRAALAQVAPGGRLVYSSCSLEREENEDVVDQALTGQTHLRLLDCRSELEQLRKSGDLVCEDVDTLVQGPFLRTLPGVHPGDGFFAGIIQKD